MNSARLAAFEKDINQVTSTYGLMAIEKTYQDIQSPYFEYILGKVALYKLEYNMFAVSHFKSAINYGVNSTNSYFNTPYADSIAQSILELLSIKKFEYEIEYKLFALAYVYFSSLINTNGSAAYESNEGRALLLTNHRQKNSLQSLLKKYYSDSNDLVIEILTVGDFFNASIGYNSENETANADRAKELAIAQTQYLFQHPNYPMLSQLSLTNIIKLSNENSNFFYQKLEKDFKSKMFDLQPL